LWHHECAIVNNILGLVLPKYIIDLYALMAYLVLPTSLPEPRFTTCHQADDMYWIVVEAERSGAEATVLSWKTIFSKSNKKFFQKYTYSVSKGFVKNAPKWDYKVILPYSHGFSKIHPATCIFKMAQLPYVPRTWRCRRVWFAWTVLVRCHLFHLLLHIAGWFGLPDWLLSTLGSCLLAEWRVVPVLWLWRSWHVDGFASSVRLFRFSVDHGLHSFVVRIVSLDRLMQWLLRRWEVTRRTQRSCCLLIRRTMWCWFRNRWRSTCCTLLPIGRSGLVDDRHWWDPGRRPSWDDIVVLSHRWYLRYHLLAGWDLRTQVSAIAQAGHLSNSPTTVGTPVL